MACDPVRVEATSYVPFEPRADALRIVRADLRARLRTLAAEKGEVLGARFYGPLPRGADVENALLYNIDASGVAFAAAARFGVRFEHDPAPLEGGGVRYEYGLESAAGFRVWAPARRLASVEARLDAAPTLATIWWALREKGQIEIGAPGRTSNEPFAVCLHVAGPANGAQPALVKTLVDGVVCALQSQTDSEGADALAPLLASSLGAPPERVREHLLDDGPSVLGTRAQLVHPRGKGVQWAPDDDFCVAGEVLIDRGEGWTVSGRVFAVVRR